MTCDFVKQKPGYHLFYLLLIHMQLTIGETAYGDGTSDVDSFHIGLILGPGLAGGNFIVATSANKKFKTELEQYNLRGKTIKAGETTYGLIGVKTDSFDAIQLKVD